MGCGCVKDKIAEAEKLAAQKLAQQTKQVSRTPQSRETYRRVLEEAAKAKPSQR